MTNNMSSENYKMRQYQQHVTIAKVKYAIAKVIIFLIGKICTSG